MRPEDFTHKTSPDSSRCDVVLTYVVDLRGVTAEAVNSLKSRLRDELGAFRVGLDGVAAEIVVTLSEVRTVRPHTLIDKTHF